MHRNATGGQVREERTLSIKIGSCDRVCLFQGNGNCLYHLLTQVPHFLKSSGDRRLLFYWECQESFADAAFLDEFIMFSEQNVQIFWLIHPTLILRSNKEPRTLVIHSGAPKRGTGPQVGAAVGWLVNVTHLYRETWFLSWVKLAELRYISLFWCPLMKYENNSCS